MKCIMSRVTFAPTCHWQEKLFFEHCHRLTPKEKKTLHIRSYYQNCFSLSGMRVFLFGLPFSGLVDITIYTPTTLNMFSYLVVVGSLDGGGWEGHNSQKFLTIIPQLFWVFSQILYLQSWGKDFRNSLNISKVISNLLSRNHSQI